MPPTETAAPRLERPRFHVWMSTEDDPDSDPAYVGIVTVTNQDQLTAETQGKAYGVNDPSKAPFHLTNLWIWAAMVRTQKTAVRFNAFCKLAEYRPVDPDPEPGPDPTYGATGPNTVSASPLPSSSETPVSG